MTKTLEDIGFSADMPTDKEVAKLFRRLGKIAPPSVSQNVLHRDGVVISISTGCTLQGGERGVNYMSSFGKATGVVLNGIATTPDARGMGLASKALRDVVGVIGSYGPATVDVEPIPISAASSPLGRPELISWYERHGFVAVPREKTVAPRVWRLTIKGTP